MHLFYVYIYMQKNFFNIFHKKKYSSGIIIDLKLSLPCNVTRLSELTTDQLIVRAQSDCSSVVYAGRHRSAPVMFHFRANSMKCIPHKSQGPKPKNFLSCM